jgi:hypothetical protein
LQVEPLSAIDFWKGLETALLGGYSISKILLDSDHVSKSVSPRKAITRFPPTTALRPANQSNA